MPLSGLRSSLPFAAVGFVLLAGSVASVELGRLDMEKKVADQHGHVMAELGTVRARLDGIIQSTFSSTDGLIDLVELSGGIDKPLFESMARLAIGKNKQIRNITLAPDDRVSMVFPLKGNEKVLGFHYATVPEQYQAVVRAREEQRAILDGPVKLVQGGLGLVNRSPIFMDRPEGPRYWGTASVVAYTGTIFEASGVTSAKDIVVAIRGKGGRGSHGEMVVGDPALFSKSPVLLDMAIPGGDWQLAAVPMAGWQGASLLASIYFQLGMANTLLIAAILAMVASQARRIRLKNALLEHENQERLRVESALREGQSSLRAQQELLHAIVDSAGAVIYVFDVEGRLLLCNSQFELSVGHRREDIIGKRRVDFLPVLVASEHDANDRTVIATRARTSFEEHNVEPDGVHYYLTVKCPVIEHGQMRAVVGISTDITERRKSDEQLRLAGTILATTAEGVVITDEEAKIVGINRAFTEITGFTESEALGKNPSILRSERQDADFYQRMWASLVRGDVWQGEIWNRRKSGEIFPEWLTITAIRDSQGAVRNYVGVFSDISSLKRSQEQLEHLAHFDPLTDLPNRILFRDRLALAIERAHRHQRPLAILIMDLDGFKTVNDSLGHPVGDRLLQEVAERLKTCVRAEDTVARLGGDEFGLALSELLDPGDAVEVIRKILASIQAPFSLDGISAMVTASIGISAFPADGSNAIELIRNADAAMYGAKEAGRNTYRFYQSSMTDRAHERLQRERALRRGVDNQEFEVWFQPQIELATGRLTGAEALVRWRDPERGLIGPIDFIPLAERTGLIVPLGEQVLRQVCRLAREWERKGLHPGKLAVNVAPTQLERSDFVATMRSCLAEAQLAPDRIEIEITESLIMENAAHAREVLLAIRELRVGTAIDDFGTGYSSLAYLKQLPIDKLKIDRTFIKDLPDDHNDIAITRTIIAMAHSMGFKVIAEGLETEAQRDFLRREGCDQAQGYLISRPLPAGEFEAWLERCRVQA